MASDKVTKVLTTEGSLEKFSADAGMNRSRPMMLVASQRSSSWRCAATVKARLCYLLALVSSAE